MEAFQIKKQKFFEFFSEWRLPTYLLHPPPPHHPHQTEMEILLNGLTIGKVAHVEYKN